MVWSHIFTSLLAPIAQAQLVTYNGGAGTKYALSIPEQTAMKGEGPIFFQLMGPTSMQWVGFGFGEEMKGANIFVMWADGSGNVTVSPRKGVGNVMPVYNPMTKFELLDGTGIMNGMMVANVMCMNCEKWDGGMVDFKSTKQSFIHAYRSGSAIDSMSEQHPIMQHQKEGQAFSFNIKDATGGSMVNPFTQKAEATETAGSKSTSSGSSSEESESEDESELDTLTKAHGILMGLAVVVMFPLGAIIIRALGFSGSVWLHAGWQVISLCLLTAGFGIGYHLADEAGSLYTGSGKTHTTLGTCLFAFFWLQPFLGFAHHLMYKKKHSRTAVSYVHVWYGRAILILAIINGGLGLQWAANTTGGEIAYGVLAGVIGVVWLAFAAWGEVSKARQPKETMEK